MFVSANVDSKLICSSFINGEGKFYCLSRFTNSFNLLLFQLNVFVNQSPLYTLKESFRNRLLRFDVIKIYLFDEIVKYC